jgi:hypothetical protein
MLPCGLDARAKGLHFAGQFVQVFPQRFVLATQQVAPDQEPANRRESAGRVLEIFPDRFHPSEIVIQVEPLGFSMS